MPRAPLLDGAGLDVSSGARFYETAREQLFTPPMGPGRVDVALSDKRILDLLEAVAPERGDGVLFVVPCPAGVVGIRREPRPYTAIFTALDELPTVGEVLREGRHDRGWPKGSARARWRELLAALRIRDGNITG